MIRSALRTHTPAYTGRSTSVGLILVHRHRQWSNMKPKLDDRLVPAATFTNTYWDASH